MIISALYDDYQLFRTSLSCNQKYTRRDVLQHSLTREYWWKRVIKINKNAGPFHRSSRIEAVCQISTVGCRRKHEFVSSLSHNSGIMAGWYQYTRQLLKLNTINGGSFRVALMKVFCPEQYAPPCYTEDVEYRMALGKEGAKLLLKSSLWLIERKR